MSTYCSACGWCGLDDVAACPDCGNVEHEELVREVEAKGRAFRAFMQRPIPAEVYFPSAAQIATSTSSTTGQKTAPAEEPAGTTATSGREDA